ncbi:MAG: Unknown protein [uncultured Aureispira sp.]|uniref:Uncharacterized protein n=1 Tax=uncultured Aureispira sp. TaxID=1331704 RepID=A0A6S6UK50_9BACT|nr:MAG: Unknown protein [uncultured Aureispira sp.]
MQAAVFGGSGVLGMLGAALMAKEALTIWMVGTSCILLYSLINNAMSLFVEDYKKYLIHSVYGFMFTMIAIIAIATILSGLSVSEAGGYRMILMIVLVANFIFIAMIMTVKNLLTFIAKKDEKL